VNLAPATTTAPGNDPTLPVWRAGPLDPRPFYFGQRGRPLFGWLHPAPAASVGLLICNPFGDEAVRTHRTTHHLAARASTAGVPTFRFDYDGTGDSAGHDLDPDRLAHWLSSIHLAADTLRRLSGVTTLCFAGIRLGATLATLAAQERSDVAGLIAMAPVVSGKAYVRELRLLRRAMDSKRNIASSDGDKTLESAGFLLSETTQTALTQVDLLALPRRAAPRLLILDRTEMPSGEKWAQKLRTLEAEVEYSPVTGYAEMMLDSHESTVPEDLLRTATEWLRHLPPNGGIDRPRDAPPPADSAVIAPPAIPDAMSDDALAVAVEEHAVRFGDSNRLFGIVSVPENRSTRTKSNAVILLNAGAVNHIGPSRMYVTIARYLAQLGYVVLRMDIASIGDSPPYPGQPEIDVYSPYALQDVASAVEYLQRSWHVDAIVSSGVCSGAYHSFKAAVARYPLRQVILINPLTFFWKPGMSLQYPEYRVAQDMRRYQKTMLNLAAWRKLLTGQVDLANLARVLTRGARDRALRPLRTLARALGRPLAEDLPTELRTVLQASIDLQFVFSVGDPGLHLLQTQGGGTTRSLQARGQLGIALVEDANHTFTDLPTRRRLLRVLVEKLGAVTSGRRDKV
jgi:alpha-beta hydrolase superfamily lysophospholipase